MTIYIPILKWKLGEYTAFGRLKSEVRSQVTPLFEITPPDYDFEDRVYNKTIDQHVSRFAVRYKKHCHSEKIFLDTHLIPSDMKMQDGKLPLEYLYSSIEQENNVIPVAFLNAPKELLDVITAPHLIDGRGACLRLFLPDLLDQEFHTKVDSVLEALDIPPEEIDLIVDLERPTKFDPISDFVLMLASIISTIPYLQSWRTFAIAATAFPKSMTEITNKMEKRERKEWAAYKQLMKNKGLERKPIYSDYGIVGPGYEPLDYRKITRKCSAKYTIDNYWMILKGKKTSKDKDWMKDYHDLADSIAKSDFYFGKDYSAGDKFISECAAQKKDLEKGTNKTKSGNPATWIAVGVNHHITKIVEDLSNMAAL